VTDRLLAIDHRLENVPAAWLDSLVLQSGAAHPLSVFTPVLALTITRGEQEDREVLVCVRDPRENVTHPDVLSSPTRRLRNDDGIERALEGGAGEEQVAALVAGPALALLRDKLGLTESFEEIRISRAAVWQGDSVIGMRGGSPVVEHLTMLNAHIDWPSDAPEIPEATPSYSSIQWVSEAGHERIVATRDALCADLTFGDLRPVVYGLCTHSTAAMLAATATSAPLLASAH
jgi:hypothetical protein